MGAMLKFWLSPVACCIFRTRRGEVRVRRRDDGNWVVLQCSYPLVGPLELYGCVEKRSLSTCPLLICGHDDQGRCNWSVHIPPAAPQLSGWSESSWS
ncbi:hypothetical protein B0J18DRAFT_418596 [Chaetomium sp. MPI-SDFR-AT-0129]|nr:hypothetical protein B0J18DRAFT_418596 [Chaetomium sp. MPI-SDFR-AT-0129]